MFYLAIDMSNLLKKRSECNYRNFRQKRSRSRNINYEWPIDRPVRIQIIPVGRVIKMPTGSIPDLG